MSDTDDHEDPTRIAYMWRIVMSGGQVVEFIGGATAGALQFVNDVQAYHTTGEAPKKVKNFRFPAFNNSTELAADVLVDITKVQMVLRSPVEYDIRTS